MSTANTTRRLLRSSLIAVVLWVPAQALAGMTWFDETRGGPGYATLGAMNTAYSAFLGPGDTRLDWDALPAGTKLGTQFVASDGVRFLNTGGGAYDAYSGVQAEGGSLVEDLTGYDGSYMPQGNPVCLKFDNNAAGTPFTFTFASPVSQVGAFFGMGKEGTVHSLTVSVYDSVGALLGQRSVESWLWDSKTNKQNFESFFAFKSTAADIARVELRNNSTTDFSNALILDNLEFGRQVPEPGALLLLGAVAAVFSLWRGGRR